MDAPGVDAALDSPVVDASTGDTPGTDAPAVDAPTDGGPLTFARFLTDFVAAGCVRTVRCEGKFGALGAFEILCHPAMSGAFLDFAGFGAAGTTFDPANAQACLEWMRGTDCTVASNASACLAVFTGNSANGASCKSHVLTNNCVSGFCAGGGCGVCSPTGSLGAACGGPSDPPCRTGLACRSGTCTTLGSLGDPCSGDECGVGLWCDGSPSTCRALPNVGEHCNILFLGVDPCRGSLVCHDSVCVDGAAEGAACGSATNLPCRPGLRCGPLNTCVPIAAPGGHCLSRANCPVAHECVSEICVALPVVGRACSPTLPCAEGGCRAGTCQRLPDGAPCAVPVDPMYDTLRSGFHWNNECAGYCDGTLCAAAVATGGACPLDEACSGNSACVTGSAADAGNVCTVCAP